MRTKLFDSRPLPCNLPVSYGGALVTRQKRSAHFADGPPWPTRDTRRVLRYCHTDVLLSTGSNLLCPVLILLGKVVEAAVKQRLTALVGHRCQPLHTMGDKGAGRQLLDGPYMARVAPHALRLAGAFADVCVVRHPWHAQRRHRGCVSGLDVCTTYKGPLE